MQLLLDEREIQRTLHQYARSLDYGDRVAFLDCFLSDATWSRLFRNPEVRPSATHRGHNEIGSFFDSHSHAPDQFHKHLNVQHEIDVDGDRALVSSYFVRVDEHPSGPFIRAFGRYRDELVRCPDGRWRIAIRQVQGEDWDARPLRSP